ncbi:acetyl-CoA acetyltransferase, putative [Pediculus humanus corporis]|uniref:Acetyl-CoA acetyltransferase, putative n=1 Tax=Pediculus humanus subsp. corporis TaxID=121224 RepID=E0VC61_PEDHC|nr:acetyl-CoA acetyltransferase, putative [Pediculus humanus corporis]EEB10967.1 acetyl-CoA acetyltransferase, putative [Pediculus humanus corporis]
MGQAPFYQIAYYSGLPTTVIASSINKLCGSGLRSIINASQTILTQTQEVVACGGIESLTNVPFFMRRKCFEMGTILVPDILFHDGLNDFLEEVDVTAYAEITARDYNIGRKEQDEYGIRSYNKAMEARKKGFFNDEIEPVEIQKKGGKTEMVCDDEEIDGLDLTKYYNLKSINGEHGTVTAGNSSNLADGGCMLVLASGNYVLKQNLKPLARVVSFAEGSLEPKQFCIAPAVAIPKALLRANLCANDIHLWEIHETFSLTPLILINIFKLDPERVNIHGGGVSMGHPFG